LITLLVLFLFNSRVLIPITNICKSITYILVLYIPNNINSNINLLLFSILDITILVGDNTIRLLLYQSFIITFCELNLVKESSEIYNIVLEYDMIEVEDFIDFDKKSQVLEVSKSFIYITIALSIY